MGIICKHERKDFYLEKDLLYLKLLSLNSEYNVNRNYKHIMKIKPNNYTNKGFYRTYEYVSLISKEELEKQRKEFWDTRVGGNPIVWKKLRDIIQNKNIERAVRVLKNGKIYPIGNSLEICLDKSGRRYAIPIYIINDPVDYSLKTEQKKLIIKNREVKLDFKFGNQNFQLSVFLNETIQNIKDKVVIMMKDINLNDLENQKVLFFYKGKNLSDDFRIGDYVENDCVIQIFLQQKK